MFLDIYYIININMYKTLVLLACLVACGYSWDAYAEDKSIKFNYDVHEGLPFSIYMEGELDPKNEQNNKINAFLRLANKYIPILESFAGKENNLKWEQTWVISFAGVNLDVYAYFQLIVGWRVNPGGYTSDRFDVTYYPFVWGGTYGRLNGTTWLAVGSSETGLRYVYAYAPISLQLFSTGRVCFQGSYVVEPVHLYSHLFAALTECHDEILDDLLDNRSIFDWTCNFTAPVNTTVVDANLTDSFTGDIIGQTCFN
jgi:hypothetical protein